MILLKEFGFSLLRHLKAYAVLHVCYTCLQADHIVKEVQRHRISRKDK